MSRPIERRPGSICCPAAVIWHPTNRRWLRLSPPVAMGSKSSSASPARARPSVSTPHARSGRARASRCGAARLRSPPPRILRTRRVSRRSQSPCSSDTPRSAMQSAWATRSQGAGYWSSTRLEWSQHVTSRSWSTQQESTARSLCSWATTGNCQRLRRAARSADWSTDSTMTTEHNDSW